MIEKIVEGQPVKIDAENEVVFTKESIDLVMANIDEVNQRVENLFSK